MTEVWYEERLEKTQTYKKKLISPYVVKREKFNFLSHENLFN